MERRKPRVVVVGSINMDLVIACRRIPAPGETVSGKSASEFCGGKGANQAVAAAQAGAEVTLIGRVGDDGFGSRLLANLAAFGIDGSHVQVTENCSSGLAVISVEESGQNAITVVPGANGCLTIADVRRSRDAIESSDVLMVQLETPVETVIEAIKIARAAGVRVILDPAPALRDCTDEVLRDLFAVDLICPNESEAEAFVGHAVGNIAQAEQGAKRLHELGAAHVAITLGDQGTLLHDGEVLFIPAFKVHAVDTTAAGDAFAGALATRWSETSDLKDAVTFANAAGALAASKRGAQASMPTRAEIETLWGSR